MASASSVRPYPTFTHHRPAMASRYERSWVSQSRTPLPRTMVRPPSASCFLRAVKGWKTKRLSASSTDGLDEIDIALRSVRETDYRARYEHSWPTRRCPGSDLFVLRSPARCENIRRTRCWRSRKDKGLAYRVAVDIGG